MKKFFAFFIFLLAFTQLSASVGSGEKIIMIHGFFGSAWNLKYQEYKLKKKGFHVTCWDYKSRKKTIQTHAENLVAYLNEIAEKHPQQPIHFVTHSMGGLILRAAVNHPQCPAEAKCGRAVLLAPPNQGSSWGRMLGEWRIMNTICEDQSGEELLTQENFDYLGEFPSSMQIKVIAGDRGLNPFLHGPHDGTVTVEETYLNTPHEHDTIHEEHLFILFSKKAAKAIREFFQRD
jgi:pimeloyl-ACP methyl ester carboxylesterase